MENIIAREVGDSAVRVHKELGSGLLESVYERALAYDLARRGLSVEAPVPVPVHYRGEVLGDGFRADMNVGAKVLVELKSVEHATTAHKKQLITYLRLSG